METSASQHYAPNARDDVANAAAGALVGTLERGGVDHEAIAKALAMNQGQTKPSFMDLADADGGAGAGSRWKPY